MQYGAKTKMFFMCKIIKCETSNQDDSIYVKEIELSIRAQMARIHLTSFFSLLLFFSDAHHPWSAHQALFL